jgi:hypothetical protein
VSALAAGLLALALLSVLPGLLVVRSPWTAVPALSLAFWALSAWWPPVAGRGRGRVLAAAALVFGLLALLRLLPKHEVPPPPGWRPPPAPPPPARPGLPPPPATDRSSLLAMAVALALLVPVPLWHHAPGARLAFQTTMARLLLWRDGVPLTAEPLLPIAPVGAHAPALATLAADVSHLSGLDPAPSLLLVVVAAAGLLLIGLFALHATWAPPRVAALGAVVGLAAAPWPGALSAWGEGEAILGLAFALPAAALLLGHGSRSSAVAAGMLLAAATLAQPLLATAMLLAAAGRLGWRGSAGRLLPALALAVPLVAPGLWPLVQSLSPREVVLIARGVRPGELLALAVGLGLVASAPFALVRLAEPRSRTGRFVAAGLAVVGAALLVARVHGWIASGQLPPSAREALARARGTNPLDPLCAPEGAREWVPALAGRRAGEPGPWIPPAYADEWAARIRRPCGAKLEALGFEPVTTFDGRERNRRAFRAYYP